MYIFDHFLVNINVWYATFFMMNRSNKKILIFWYAELFTVRDSLLRNIKTMIMTCIA